MGNPLVCCFDCNDVLINLGRSKAEHARRMFRVECCPQRFKRKYVVSHGLLTDAQYEEVHQAVYDPEHLLSLDPVDGAIESIEALIREKHRVCIVTSRTGNDLEVMKEWWRMRSRFTIDLFGTGKGKSKGPMLRELHADTFVDNDLKKLRKISEEGIPTQLFLLSWCNNVHHKLPEHVRRLSSFRQFREEILALGAV